jgi:hypothetical protein
MCGNLTTQVRNIANVTTAVARSDLSRKITVDVRGEILPPDMVSLREAAADSSNLRRAER